MRTQRQIAKRLVSELSVKLVRKEVTTKKEYTLFFEVIWEGYANDYKVKLETMKEAEKIFNDRVKELKNYTKKRHGL